MKHLLAICLVLAGVLFGTSAAAHDTLTSSVVLDVRANAIDAELLLPLDQLQMAGAWPASETELETYVVEHFSITDERGWPFSIAVAERSVDASFLKLTIAMQAPPDAQMQSLKIHDDIILHRVVTHRILISTRRDFELASFDTKLAGVLTYTEKDLVVDRSGGGALHGMTGVLVLGAKHIAEGTDHLLFLLVLLLSAPLFAKSREWTGVRTAKVTIVSVLRVVTAFTIGHSISLALATLGWVSLPSRPVEIAIAISILATAVHAIRPIFGRNEPAVAGFFGLVHGFAFAGALAEFGFTGRELGLSLLGFNLGIEIMQLGVVLAFLPWLLLLSRTDFYRRFRIGVASLAGVAAIGWAVERVVGRSNAVTQTAAAVASHPFLILGALAVAALAVTVGPWISRPLVRQH